MRKKLIEVALPLEAINVASAREKSIRHGHPSTLHLWWARRPLAAARAVIFTSLVDDPDDPNAPPEFVAACRKLDKGANASVEDTPRQRLFDFIETLVKWESTTDETVLNTARELIKLSTGGNPPPLLDPFAGGGSIPLEAQRLGLEAHASDLNPVAVMINKALIEIPPRFSNLPPVNPRDREKIGGHSGWKGAQGLAADVRYYGEWMRDRAWERIGHLYPKGPNGETVIAWIWARTIKSPNPAVDVHVPLVSTFWLSKSGGSMWWVEPVIGSDRKIYRFEVRHGVPEDPRAVSQGTKSGGRATFRCLISNVPITPDYIREEGTAGKMRSRLMAMVCEGANGRFYLSPTSEHEDTGTCVNLTWRPEIQLARNPRYMSPTLYGLGRHVDLYTARQFLTLTVLSDLLSELYEQIKEDTAKAASSGDSIPWRDHREGVSAYSKALITYLGLTPSKAARFLSTQSFWRADAGKLSRGFGRQAVSMTWDYAETNPFSGTGGDILGLVEGTAEALERVSTVTQGTVEQRDAGRLPSDLAPIVISTDPPYYDNVPYADLSDIFYLWMRRSLAGEYPTLFSTLLVPKDAEIVADPLRHGGRDEAQRRFEVSLASSFERMRVIQHPDYPLTMYYAFKQSEIVIDGMDGNSISSTSSTGWETMLEAMISASFQITGTVPIRTEGPTRMRNLSSNALASSIVLVCRPRPDDAPTISRREFVNALRRELPEALRKMQSGSIAPVDLAQASIGPGMAVYSRYSRVLEADGSPLTVRTALQLINQELDAFLAETEGDVDADTRFAVSWFEQSGFKAGTFGVADVLARAKNTSVDGLVNAGVVEAGAGKVRLKSWDELEPGWTPQGDKRVTVWEAVHHLIERLNTHGEQGAASLLAQMDSDLAAEAKNLAYRLYQICDRKGWAEYALEYNAVVLSWPGVQQQATVLKQNPPPEQLGMFSEE